MIVAISVGGRDRHGGTGQGDGDARQTTLSGIMEAVAVIILESVSVNETRFTTGCGCHERAGDKAGLVGDNPIVLVANQRTCLQRVADQHREANGGIGIAGDRADGPTDHAVAHAAGGTSTAALVSRVRGHHISDQYIGGRRRAAVGVMQGIGNQAASQNRVGEIALGDGQDRHLDDSGDGAGQGSILR